ncbi:hypothetical protein MMC24_001059 [Lignoscripta atroalba]|nr:hypothetical protein [Lignoscripta atroalba]
MSPRRNTFPPSFISSPSRAGAGMSRSRNATSRLSPSGISRRRRNRSPAPSSSSSSTSSRSRTGRSTHGISKTTVDAPGNVDIPLSKKMKRAIQVDGWKLKGFLKRSLKEEIEEIVAEKVQAAVGVWMGEMKTGGHNIGEVLMKALAPKIAEEKDKAEKKVERDLAVLRAKNQELQDGWDRVEESYGRFYREFEDISYQAGNEQRETSPDSLLDWLVQVLGERRQLTMVLDREIERRRAAEEQLHVENRMWDELQHVARTRGFRARLPRAVLLGLDEV